jgi:acyl-CoA thioester hydrolase
MTNDALPTLHRTSVQPEWIDFNGHMNVAYYVLAFDQATDKFFDQIGLDEAYRTATNRSTFAVEQHVMYLREVKLGDPLRFTTQLIDYDAKRVHYFHRMYHDGEGYLAATSEILSVHIDLGLRRSVAFGPPDNARLVALAAAHAGLPRPEQSGRVIGIRRTPRP